jgi:ABC-2 type transport system permease protein
MIGRPAPLQIVIDGRNSNTAAIALSYASEIVLGFDADWAAAHGGRAAPATLEVRAWYNPNLLSRWFVVPGIVGLLTFVVTMLVSGLSVVREREAGTFDQLLVTPYRPWEILLGKAAPGLLIGAAEASVIVVVAVTWFGVPLIGSVVALALGLALFLVSAIGIGLMISSLAATQQQGLLGAFLFLVPAIILSGFATPIENMPRLVQYVTYLNPMRYLMVILRGTFLEGDGFVALLGQYWPLALLGAASMTAATALARRRMG